MRALRIEEGWSGGEVSSIRITRSREDKMRWVANRGQISANLCGDVYLQRIVTYLKQA